MAPTSPKPAESTIHRRSNGKSAKPSGEPIAKPKTTQQPKADNQLTSLILAILLSALITTALLWYMDFLSSGSWEDKVESRVQFLTDDSALREDLLKLTMPMTSTVIAFYSESCLHCKKMRLPFLKCSNDFADARFVGVNLSGDSQIVKSNLELAKSFGVTHVPTIFFLTVQDNAEGEAAVTKVRYQDRPSYSQLQKFIQAQLSSGQNQEQSVEQEEIDEITR